MAKIVEKPEVVEQEHLDFLNDLRESGDTNMFGATPYLIEEFALDKYDARAILSYWMATFTQD